ncbi:DUF2817 domain-containing protein [Draconibacterium sp.]|nr:DUF2817 domain-containing protein [Draconibacterium sp.]
MPIKIHHKLEDTELIEKKSSARSTLAILVIGVFHGEEPQGAYIINRYLKKRDFKDINNHLFFIPCLNPFGMKRGIRVNSNGVDLNRNYPTKNWELTIKDENYSGMAPASEVETKFMIEVLEKVKPDVILTLHAPLKLVNYDGPAKHMAEKIAEICGYPVQKDIGYSTPGSFGTYCGIERNIPTITLEFDEEESNKSLYNKAEAVLDYLSNLPFK